MVALMRDCSFIDRENYPEYNRMWKNLQKDRIPYSPSFSIITSSFSIFSVSSAMRDSLLFDESSICSCHPECSCHSILDLESCFCHCMLVTESSFCNPHSCHSGFMPESCFPLQPTLTRTFESSLYDSMSLVFCFSRNILRDFSGSMISDLRELIYFSLSKRFPLFARCSTFSSLITSEILSEKVDERVSNQSERTQKFISFWKFFWICLDSSSMRGVSFWIFSQRFQKA